MRGIVLLYCRDELPGTTHRTITTSHRTVSVYKSNDPSKKKKKKIYVNFPALTLRDLVSSCESY